MEKSKRQREKRNSVNYLNEPIINWWFECSDPQLYEAENENRHTAGVDASSQMYSS